MTNQMKSRLIVVLFGMLLPLCAFSQQNRERIWEVDEHQFSNTMVMVVQVYLDGVLDPTLEVGAFCGDVCRGIAVPKYEPVLNDTYWYLNVQGENSNSELLNFYARRDGVEIAAVTNYSIYFEIDGVVGHILHAQIIEFTSASDAYYTLITDNSQLVAGRKYLLANGYEGTVKALAGAESSLREAVDITCSGRKAYLTPGLNSEARELVLGGTEGEWTLYDEHEEGYLTAGRGGALNTNASVTPSGKWEIEVAPTGALTIYNANRDVYLVYDDEEDDPAFLCGDESPVFLLAKCELVSGTMSALKVDDPTKMFVVESGNILEVADLSTVDVSNLILEDDSQLINASSGVLATMQKTITAYADPMESDGWYTLSTPMTANLVEMGSNLIFPEYDLYYFDETNLIHEEWRNYKSNATNGFTDFEAGRGYLYANATDFTPVFKGTLNSATVTFPMTYTARPDGLTGFNLIGNPFPHDIYKGQGGAIDDSGLASGYYVLTNSGSWLAKTYEMPIEPGQGILVKTMTAHDLRIAKTNAEARGESASRVTRAEGVGCIGLHLSGGSYEDNAFAYLSPGNGLIKIAHFNANNPSLSIVQNEGNFAIANVDAESKTLDVRFDAPKAATFTITVNVKDYKNGYLHLIDNMTGADVNLLRTPTYTFESTGHDHPFRFKLVLQGVDSDDDAPFAYFADGEIRLLVELCHDASLQVMDMMGRLIVSSDAVCHISTNGMTPGVYLLRLIDGTTVRTQKIVVR